MTRAAASSQTSHGISLRFLSMRSASQMVLSLSFRCCGTRKGRNRLYSQAVPPSHPLPPQSSPESVLSAPGEVTKNLQSAKSTSPSLFPWCPSPMGSTSTSLPFLPEPHLLTPPSLLSPPFSPLPSPPFFSFPSSLGLPLFLALLSFWPQLSLRD